MSETLITNHSTVITNLKNTKSVSPDEISQAEAYKNWKTAHFAKKINYKIRHELQKHGKEITNLD